MKPLNKRPAVLQDLVEIYAWIGQRNFYAAEKFLTAVDNAFRQIRKQPGIGWERPWKSRRLKGLRSWRVKHFEDFLIFYREEEAAIEVYGVLRASRHVPRTLRRR